MNEELIKQLAEVLARQMTDGMKDKENGLHTKTPASVNTATLLHGSGGIFQGPGLDRNVISAHVRPRGISSELPILPTNDENPQFATLTGFTDVVGDEPANACEDAPAGYMKGCNLTARFGMLRRDSQTIEMDQVIRKINRGDFMDLVLSGRVLGLTENLTPTGLSQDQILNVVTAAEMVNVGVQTERALNTQLWQGNPAVGTQFAGLDRQIATGQVDNVTNVACPALDSDVKDYNYATLSSSIVNYLSQLEWYLNYNAESMGLDPVTWVIAMRPDLWFELTSIWPCAYNTTKCSPAVDTNSTVFLDGRDNTAERDAMRNGMYIDINGRRYKVVVDTGIFEHNNINNANLGAAEYASSIYMVPKTIVGNLPVTFRQYLDYRTAQPDVNFMQGKEDFWWTDEGIFSWALEQIKWCYKFSLKTEQRVVLRTPQLAGRIDNVKYTPLQHLRDPDPDSPYFFDGGASLGANVATPYAIWN